MPKKTSLISGLVDFWVLFISFDSIPSNLYMESESRPRPSCCFWYSSKNNGRKKSKSNEVSGLNNDDDDDGDNDWGKSDKILSDTSTFSVEEQERRLKKAMKEEERVSREAERVVEWVKQESARMDVSSIESMLSRDDKPFK